MDKAMQKHLKDFEAATFRRAYAGSLHPIDAELVVIGHKEIKFQLYSAIEDLETRLENALTDIDDMVDANRHHQETS
jgi:hypothetical protein